MGVIGHSSRPVTVVAALAVTALAGCGGGSTTIINQTTGPTNATTTSQASTTMVARGPSDLAENITGLLGKSLKQLKDIRIACPDEPTPPNYPVHCALTAIDTSKPSSRDVPDGAHRPVSGHITVAGVYPRTRTYAFSYDFSASSGQR